MSFNQNSGTAVPILINSSQVLVTGNAASANALTVRQFGTGNVFSAQTTTGATALFVGANGNVGIGTTNPNGPLEVQNQSSATVVENLWLTAPNLTAGQQSRFFWGKNTGIVNGGFFYYHHVGDGSTSNYFRLDFNGKDNVLCAAASGNVGIGTTNPSSRLHVQGGDIYASSNINGNAGNTTWRLQPQYVGSNPFPSNFRIANGWDPIAGTGQANYAGVGINLNSYQGGSQIEFYTSATNNAVPTERMRISTNGNVGIGTTSPGNMFQVGALVGPIYGNNPLSQSTAIILGPSPSKPTYSGTTTLGGTLFVNATDANASNVGASIALGGRGADFGGGQNHMTFARIQGTQAVTSGAYYGNFVIETQNSGILYERMRINQDGYVGIGIQTPARHFTIVDGGSSPMLIDQTSSSIGDVTILIRKASTTNLTGDNFLNFQTNATYDANGNYVSGAVQRFIVRADGYIASGSLGGGATTLSVDASGGIIRTPSDARLKSNITTITYGLDIANAIRPVFYTWNEPERLGAGRQIGMIAQEVAVLVPEAVSAGLDEDGTLSLDYQKLVPVLTKAIQELSAENTALKSRLDSLEARLAAAGL
jgi:hypothetical protein